MLHENTSKSPLSIRAVGVMSGTSLDGLDICYASFWRDKERWSFKIIDACTISYDKKLQQELRNAENLDGRELMALDASYGKWIGKAVSKFISKIDNVVDIIGSHGHTVFHEPTRGFSTQIGNGAHIAAITEISCVSNFRSGDVARGGQGAPLVPIGDELLFGDYSFCLNIGGIANISFREGNKRIAFDICPANMILNHLAGLIEMEFDKNGDVGKTGNINPELLNQLNGLPFFQQYGPKSLGREWFTSDFLSVIDSYNIPLKDKFRTVYELIAYQIALVLDKNPSGTILITGGGAKNTYLVDLIRRNTGIEVIVPQLDIVDFKEALIFGFLAVLYLVDTPTCLTSVTGASSNSIGGSLYK